MKNLKLFLAAIILTVFISCDSIVDQNEKPASEDRSQEFKLLLKDKTGTMNQIYGTDLIANTEVLLKSVTLGTESTVISDENGIVSLSGFISDRYLISANKFMSEDEMEKLTGVKQSYYKLVNSSSGIIQLNAAANGTIEIYLDNLIQESPLVISEIYACGPHGSGLYFHDKYVEIFNRGDSVIYLDGYIIADVWSNPKMGINFIDDPDYIHTKRVWKFPGSGMDYPIEPGQFVVCTEDAIDHRINAPESIDLSGVDFEFYKDDAPDIDNPNTPNMIKIFQPVSEVDWLIGGETGGLVIAKLNEDQLGWYDDHMLIPFEFILDGVEYLDDPSELKYKRLNPSIDAGIAGGIQFYTGKSMERTGVTRNSKLTLKDDNNSTIDFRINEKPTPGYHYQTGN